MDKNIAEHKIYILNPEFESLCVITDYRSFLWVDRYNKTGDFELQMPFNPEIATYAVLDNYVWYSQSDKMMIIEKIEIVSNEKGEDQYNISGRSLESIMDRRVIFQDITGSEQSAESLIKQIINDNIITPSGTFAGRKIDNFVYVDPEDETIKDLKITPDYKKGDRLSKIIEEICEYHSIGYKITLNDNEQFEFQLYKGADRSCYQDDIPWVIFSRRNGNLISYKTTTDETGDNYRSTIYATYRNQAGSGVEFEETVIVGDQVTGLMRREMWTTTEGDNSSATYNMARQCGITAYIEHGLKVNTETEVETKIGFAYGKDYFIGDLVQIDQTLLINSQARVTEFITQINDRGVEQYPTFETPVELGGLN